MNPPDNTTPLQAALSAVDAGDLSALAHAWARLSAAPSERDPEGWTPLTRAASRGQAECLQWLAIHGAPLNQFGPSRETACLIAVKSGHLGCLRALLDLGADPAMHNLGGLDPLSASVELNQPDAFWALLSHGADPAEQRFGSFAALARAASLNRVLFLTMAAEKGVDLDARDTLGRTPAWVAAVEGHVEALEFLLDHGADPNCSHQGYSMALGAAASGNAQCLELLLDRGADLRVVDDSGRSLASCAAEQGSAACVELLARCGADLRSFDQYGWSPASWAASRGAVDALRALSMAGVDLSLLDGNGESCIEMAERKNHSECADWLRGWIASRAVKNELDREALPVLNSATPPARL